MVSSTPSDPLVAAAIWTGAAALGLTLLMSLQIVLLRASLRRGERREAQALARWRPILNAAIVGETPELPRLAGAERLPFLRLWVHLQTSLRGDAAAALCEVARRLAMDAHARHMLARGPRAERLLAALVLGHLGDRQAWHSLLRLAEQDDATLSLTALWALVRIDPEQAARFLTQRFIERDDWALSHVAGILQHARTPVGEVLATILPGLAQERLPRALRIAEALRVNLPPDVLRGALASASVPVVVAALRSVFAPALLDAVRALLAHEDWQVRVQAVRALGRIGERGDAQRLLVLLGDSQWWVRYRAAEALLDLPMLAPGELAALRARLTDRYAADMLTQVMAERAAGEPALALAS